MKYYIFRNSTIEPFFKGIEAEYSSYDNISLENVDLDNLIWFYTLPIENDSDKLINIIDGYINKINFLVSRIPESSNFFIFTLEEIFTNRFESSGGNSIRNKICGFNSFIYEVSEKFNHIKILDFSEFINRFSILERIDWKFYYLYSCIINPKLNKEFIRWFNKQIEAVKFIRKKCIIIDLDNTIWGGIAGEEGPNNIKLGSVYPGNAFLDFQKDLLEAQKSGVLLAICSKNNENDIKEVWEKNPNMILKPEHFVSMKINWNNKHENISEIARELNIGLNSIVFLDDNKTERELVKYNLKDVIVPDYPEQPYMLKEFFKNVYNKFFFVHNLTEEDKQKTIQYQIRKSGLDSVDKFKDYDEFLQSLEIKVEISEANDSNIPRISQMTQKTNQFNLTTIRYTEQELRKLLSGNYKAFCVDVSDKYGNYGITGCTIIRVDSINEAYIDTFLLSCRIIGKGIEKVFLTYVLNKLKDSGINTIKSTFIRTQKNTQTEKFYDNYGFNLILEKSEIKEYIYVMDNIRPYDKGYNIGSQNDR